MVSCLQITKISSVSVIPSVDVPMINIHVAELVHSDGCDILPLLRHSFGWATSFYTLHVSSNN